MTIEKARKVCIRKDCPLRHICKLHIYQVSGLTPVRTWMSEKTGHDCDHFQAAPDIDVAMRDGTLDGGIC